MDIPKQAVEAAREPGIRETVIRILWEKQFEGSPWATKFHLIRPDSLDADYGTFADKLISTIRKNIGECFELVDRRQPAAQPLMGVQRPEDVARAIEHFLFKYTINGDKISGYTKQISEEIADAILSLPTPQERGGERREEAWLIERHGTYACSYGASPDWSPDPWRAVRYQSLDEADAARLYINFDQFRDESDCTLHIFVYRASPKDSPRIHHSLALPHTGQPQKGTASAVAAEREACAKLAEDWHVVTGETIAAEIRARANTFVPCPGCDGHECDWVKGVCAYPPLSAAPASPRAEGE
jgi:hypothetical protein